MDVKEEEYAYVQGFELRSNHLFYCYLVYIICLSTIYNARWKLESEKEKTLLMLLSIFLHLAHLE